MRKFSSLALAVGFILPLAGCPGDDTDTTGTTVATTNATMNMTTTMDPPGSGTETPATSTPTGTVDPDSGTSPTSESEAESMGGGGFCNITCEAPEDCAFGGDASQWECNDGWCDFVGEIPDCDPTMCDDLGIGVCANVEGQSTCTTPCPNGDECTEGSTECTGEDDDGNAICVGLPCGGVSEGEPCEIPMFGSIGTCTEGQCTCEGDEECTADGLACDMR